jgi:hypothetical protein
MFSQRDCFAGGNSEAGSFGLVFERQLTSEDARFLSELPHYQAIANGGE